MCEQKGKIQNKNRWKREEAWWKMKWPLPQKVDEEKTNRLASRLREGMQWSLRLSLRGEAQYIDFDFWQEECEGLFGSRVLVLVHLCSNYIRKLQTGKGYKVLLFFSWSIRSKINTANLTLLAKYLRIFLNMGIFSWGSWHKPIACEWQPFLLVPRYIQTYILLLRWINQCYCFCHGRRDSPDCPGGLLTNLWFHGLLLLIYI